MTELFKRHKKTFIRQLGKGALGKEMLGKKYIGTFAQDEMPNRSGYMIVNVDTSKKINTDKAHWVAIYQTPKTLYVYDSFGRLTQNVLKLISKKTKKKIVDSKHDPEQYGFTRSVVIWPWRGSVLSETWASAKHLQYIT